jgi:excisionase family DNA binding protein
MNPESKGKCRVVLERYVNIKTVSMYTSLPVSTLYEWSAAGKIMSIKIGRRVLFDLHDIDKLMARLKRTSNQYEKTTNKIIADIRDGDI